MPERYQTRNLVTLSLFDTGHCVVSAHHVMRGAARQPMACHALAALIGHPTAGWTLFDTGYAPRMLEATRRMPWRLYRLATPLHLRPELALQLADVGLRPEDIRQIIVSHVHADHVAGLRDFPTATPIVSRAALQSISGLRGLQALRRAHIPQLLPADFAARVLALSAFTGPSLPALGPTHDLFGDGSLLLVALPGHACGQIGALAQTSAGPVLLAADGAWTRQAIREIRPPARITNLFVDDPQAVRRTLAALHAFAAACPDVQIIPTHCPEVYASLQASAGSAKVSR